MGKPSLFIHIGAGKCASTAIQSFLFRNAVRLRELGFKISDNRLRFDGHEAGNPLWFVQELVGMEREAADAAIAEALDSLPARTAAVVSAENLSNPGGAAIFEKAASKMGVHVLHVVRRQDDWLYSAWKQWYSKTGISLDAFVRKSLAQGRPDFLQTQREWQAIGADVTTISLDLLGSRPVYRIILDWLGIGETDDANWYVPPEAVNASFDFRLLDIMSRYPGAFDRVHDRRLEMCLEANSRLAYQYRYRLPHDLAKEVMAAFREQNIALFGPEQTMLIDNAAPDTTRREAAIPAPRQDEHDFAVACLLETIGTMWSELSDARSRIAQLEATVGAASNSRGIR